ncbi:hypothetical protein PSAB6_220059 [Paraburkholderia sabiae]|jgi:hypothetical protein|nr:hypothetical protein PSAB6_220059 [Paraburkholderia sabiae]
MPAHEVKSMHFLKQNRNMRGIAHPLSRDVHTGSLRFSTGSFYTGLSRETGSRVVHTSDHSSGFQIAR